MEHFQTAIVLLSCPTMIVIISFFFVSYEKKAITWASAPLKQSFFAQTPPPSASITVSESSDQ